MPGVRHAVAGDSAAGTLRAARVPGEVAVFRDVLSEGPLPPLDGEAFHRSRAHFWADGSDGLLHESDVLHDLAVFDASLCAPGADETVLWFGRDPACQVALVRTLDLLARCPPQTLSQAALPAGAVCFGELDPAAMKAAFEARTAVEAAAIAAARTALETLRAPDPQGWAALAARGVPELPALGQALRAMLDDLPEVASGLPAIERRALHAVAHGPLAFGAHYFATVAHHELRGLTDEAFRRRLRALAAGPAPLIHLDGEGASLTRQGRDVLDGKARWEPSERWVLGVHLGPGLPAWRVDPARAAPVLA